MKNVFHQGILLLSFFTVAISARADSVQVDFGAPAALPSRWNNGQGLAKVGAKATLKNSSDGVTPFVLETMTSFNTVNNFGTSTAASSLGLPSVTTSDSFFGNTVPFGDGNIYDSATLELRGLDPNQAYTFQFFASRMAGDGVNRETRYTLNGATSSAVTLNATDNTAGVATSAPIRPNANGVIRVVLGKGAANNSPFGFYYLGSMKFSYASAPAPAPVTSPAPTATATPPAVPPVTTPPATSAARIEAEAFSAMSGILSEQTADVDGAQNIGWIDNGDWAEYSVNLATAGTYTLNYRVASPYSTGIIETSSSTGPGFASTQVPATGGWQTWQTVSTTISLNSGPQTIKLSFPVGGINLNWFEIRSGNSVPVPNVTTLSATGTTHLEAEAYTKMSGIQTESTQDVGGTLDVGWIDLGDFLEYAITVPSAGNYSVSFRVASPVGGSSIQAYSNGSLLGTASVPNTGSWQNWQTISVNLPLSAGAQTFRLQFPSGGLNLNWFEFLRSGATPAPVPSPVTVPSPVPVPSPITPPPAPTGRGVTTLRPLGSTAAGYGYVEYLPAGYSASGNWPILIMLHGVGEEGNGTSQLSSVRNNGPNNEIDNRGRDFPMVILTPQFPSWVTPNGDTTGLDAFVTYALANYKVNSKRLYMTGLSMGGGGTWDYAAAHGDRLAAIVPICGATSTQSTDAHGQLLVNQGVAVWSAHALDDGTVSVKNTTLWMDAIGRAYGGAGGEITFQNYAWAWTGSSTMHFDLAQKQWLFVNNYQGYRDNAGNPYNPKQIMTLYSSGGHGIWDRMYSDPNVYEWLLSQSRP